MVLAGRTLRWAVERSAIHVVAAFVFLRTSEEVVHETAKGMVGVDWRHSMRACRQMEGMWAPVRR